MSLQPWLLPAWANLRGALNSGRLGHALLVSGPALLGKRTLADALAARLLCSADSNAEFACGHCRACTLRVAGSHPDRLDVGLLERDDGRLKTEIGVDQMRELSAWFALTAQLGRAQVALIEPADRLGSSAANALLKTLEEPQPERFLILVTARPQRLPATVRSRCQRLQIGLPSLIDARAALLAQGIDAALADEALTAADGNPGLAQEYITDDSLGLRRHVRDDLAALAAGRTRAVLLAPRWMQDRPELRLRLAAECVREFGCRRAVAGAAGLVDFPRLATWFDRANRLREQFSAPLRQELLLAELLADWRAAFDSGAR